jgi:hypothetical protein
MGRIIDAMKTHEVKWTEELGHVYGMQDGIVRADKTLVAAGYIFFMRSDFPLHSSSDQRPSGFCWASCYSNYTDYTRQRVLKEFLVQLKRMVSKDGTLDVTGNRKRIPRHSNDCPGRVLREVCGFKERFKDSADQHAQQPIMKSSKKSTKRSAKDTIQVTTEMLVEESDDTGNRRHGTNVSSRIYEDTEVDGNAHADINSKDGERPSENLDEDSTGNTNNCGGSDSDSDNDEDQNSPGNSGLAFDISPEHDSLARNSTPMDDHALVGLPVRAAQGLLLEPAGATDVQTTPTTIERALLPAGIQTDPDSYYSRMRAGSNKLTGLRLPVNALKRRSPAPEESHRQGKRSKADQISSNDIDGVDPFHSH